MFWQSEWGKKPLMHYRTAAILLQSVAQICISFLLSIIILPLVTANAAAFPVTEQPHPEVGRQLCTWRKHKPRGTTHNFHQTLAYQVTHKCTATPIFIQCVHTNTYITCITRVCAHTCINTSWDAQPSQERAQVLTHMCLHGYGYTPRPCSRQSQGKKITRWGVVPRLKWQGLSHSPSLRRGWISVWAVTRK